MKAHEFYRRFEELGREKRFEVINPTPQPTSFFVIFQQLSQIRTQMRNLERKEEELLNIAEEAFKKIKE